LTPSCRRARPRMVGRCSEVRRSHGLPRRRKSWACPLSSSRSSLRIVTTVNFANTFFYISDRQIVASIRILITQLIVPFVRDYQAYVENAGRSASLRLARSRSKKIFIVYGHDGEARETVARFVGDIGFTPVLLHEWANRGRTIIEKVEAETDVSFAVSFSLPTTRDARREEPLSRVCARTSFSNYDTSSDFWDELSSAPISGARSKSRATSPALSGRPWTREEAGNDGLVRSSTRPGTPSTGTR
jgi:hypothetical protein